MSSTNKEIRECRKHWWLRYPPFVGRMRTCLKCGAIRAGDNTATIAGNYLEVTVAAAPANPGVGLARVYAISSTSTRMRDSAGTETDLAAGGVTKFTSAEQTITTGGALTLAHSLGAKPYGVSYVLKAQAAVSGYSIGDELEASPLGLGGKVGGGVQIAKGVSIVADATNLNVRYGADTAVFSILTKGGGDIVGDATNADWQVIFRAWV